MRKINPLNVAKLLFEEISAKYSKSTSINDEEIELKDNLLGKSYFCIYFLYNNKQICVYLCMHILCIRTVSTLALNRLHIRN